MKVSDVHKIAVLRANGLGDMVFALPALEALRLAYPEPELIWMGLPLHHEFFSSRPGPVDRVIIVPPSHGVRDEPERQDEGILQEFFETMAAEKLDVAVQMHGGGRFSNPFLKRLGARITVGLRSSDAIPLDRCVPYIHFQHEVLRYLEVAALLDAPCA
ncbi:glycosyltransferase family 9 protein [Nitrospira sp. Nam74]